MDCTFLLLIADLQRDESELVQNLNYEHQRTYCILFFTKSLLSKGSFIMSTNIILYIVLYKVIHDWEYSFINNNNN